MGTTLSIEKLLSLTSASLFLDRLDFFSSYFVGFSYQPNPVGDGPDTTIDTRDIFSITSFDCQTYIEAVICLARSKNTPEFSYNLLRFRYFDSPPGFYTRNHFLHCQWLPNNFSAGLIAEQESIVVSSNEELITLDVLQNLAALTSKYIKDAHELVKEIEIIKDRIEAKSKFHFKFIAFEKLVYFSQDGLSRVINENIVKNIPDPSLITFYFDDKEHMGLLLKKSDCKLYIRHARTQYGVVEGLFADYLVTLHLLSRCIGIKLLKINAI